MILETTTTYITTISKNHTIDLPTEMPVGATVAVILMPKQVSIIDEAKRHADFQATLEIIRSLPQQPRAEISDEEFDQLIEEAREAVRK